MFAIKSAFQIASRTKSRYVAAMAAGAWHAGTFASGPNAPPRTPVAIRNDIASRIATASAMATTSTGDLIVDLNAMPGHRVLPQKLRRGLKN